MPYVRTRQAEMRQALLFPEYNWSFVPDHYKCDVSCVSQFIRQARVLPAKAMLELVCRKTFDAIAKHSRLFIASRFPGPLQRKPALPPKFTNNVTVVTAYCRLIPRALQQADSALTDIPNAVLAAIQRDGGLEFY